MPQKHYCEGGRVKNSADQKVYRITRLTGSMAVLEAEEENLEVIIMVDDLILFYSPIQT
jgi:hypothetical protein